MKRQQNPIKRQRQPNKPKSCVVCGQPASPGHTDCEACFKMSNQRPAEHMSLYHDRGQTVEKAFTKALGY